MTIMCPSCSRRSRIIDSRRSGDTMRRHRECVKCGTRWRTVETMEPPRMNPMDKRRGFIVPPDRKEEYLRRMRKGNPKAKDVARAMGLIEEET